MMCPVFIRLFPAWRLAAIFGAGACFALAPIREATGADRPATGRRWQDMDYGPFLTASIEAPQPRTNIAYKGIAINLGAGSAGSHNEAIVFDTDLLRYSAGWTGHFVALKGVVFDGEHWAYPHVDGRQVFGNPPAPGWAREGSFTDPREYPYGPLPRAWAHWRGLYLHERQVIFSYTVADMPVLEMPGLERHGELAAFTRTLNLGPSPRAEIVQIAFEPGTRRALLNVSDLMPAANTEPVDNTLLMLDASAAKPRTAALEDGLLGRWEFNAARGETETDLSGHQRALSLRGVGWVTNGHEGAALQFDGSHYAEIPASDEIDFLKTDLTIAAWIRCQSDGTILAQTVPTNRWVPDGRTLFLREGRLTFDVGWVGALSSSAAVTDGQWHHVALTSSRVDGRVSLFIDGAADGSGSLKPRQALPRQVLRVGFTSPNFPARPWFRGSLDGLRIYSRVLRADEVAALAQRAPASDLLAAAVVGAPTNAQWLATGDGHARLQLPARGTSTRLKILLWRGGWSALPTFAQLRKNTPPPADLAPLTHGGPARWSQQLTTHGQLGTNEGAYAIDTLPEPDQNPWQSWLRFGGLDFFPDGRSAALCTWNGDVWVVRGLDGDLQNLTWQRIATGLFQPLGLRIVDGQIYVLGRDQITRLRDLDGDGEADFYENFNNDCMVSEHFHEFATDLKVGPDGSFYYIKCACHGTMAKHPHHGTALRVSRDGSQLEVIARGLRANNGLGVGPHGELTSIDNQGHWMPGNRINWIKPGGWYGYQWAWNPQGRTNYDEPLCWMHNFVDRSGGTQLWVPTTEWGPLQNEIITISYGMGHMFLLLKEEVGGVMQGAVTRFPLEFETGVMRGTFHPKNGQLYLCGLYGWAGNKTKAGGFYRVRHTGQPLRMATSLHIARDGIVLGFSEPLDSRGATDPGSYDVKVWNYHWTAQYGSPDFKLNGQEGRDTWRVESASLSADRRTVFLKIPEVQPVMQIHLTFDLQASDGAPVKNFAHGTIHRLGPKSGAEWVGPGAIARQGPKDLRLPQEAPGLRLTFERSQPTADDQPPDTHVARLPALFVPAGTPPTSVLASGPFRCRWEGFLKLDLNEEMAFQTEGRGSARLRINGQTALEALGDLLDGAHSGPVSLRGGLNRFELDYTSPSAGDAVLRLSWSSKSQPVEPVPPTVFVHDAEDAGLRAGELVREGRALFAQRQCAKCHKPDAPWTTNAMPELAADAPTFNGLGNRLREGWIVQWLLQPKSIRPDALMPALLSGESAPADARDIAAFLASLREPTEKALRPSDDSAGAERQPAAVPLTPFLSPNEGEGARRAGEGEHGSQRPAPGVAAHQWASADSGTPPPEVVATGARLFGDLGCVACHSLPGEPSLTNDSRVRLDHVRAKWQPAALESFLRAPAQHFEWTRMPDFKLSTGEAPALAAYVLSSANRPEAVNDSSPTGSHERGHQLVTSLGCLACHTLEGEADASHAPALAALFRRDWARGCLAPDAAQRGQAPDFSFDSSQRTALQEFSRRDALAALRHDTPVEFAERQYAALRCNACHPRDHETDLLSALTAAAQAKKGTSGNDEEADGSVHIGRPPLTFAGEKLYAGWMKRFLGGTLPYKPRPELQGRMPAFPAYARLLAEGMAQEHGYRYETSPGLKVNPQLAEVGRKLTGLNDGFSCIACHDVGDQKALAGKDTATVNFAAVAERLRPSYYWRYVKDPPHILPTTMMPKFIGDDGTTPIKSVFDGDPQRQFTAIWHYLNSLRDRSPGP